MGNRALTATSAQPTGPPALLSAAVNGDPKTFNSIWSRNDDAQRFSKDRQDNNVLHALFSSRAGKAGEILREIHETLTSVQLIPLYLARNHLGCTPLWILIAYGNVDLLQQVVNLASDELKKILPAHVGQPNNQGDTPVLATCSQGNVDMVKYLASCSLDDASWLHQGENAVTMDSLVTQGNKKGTTPVQIVVANGHLELLQFLLQHCNLPSDQLWQVNAAGLSLFHICSERNFHDGLQALLDHIATAADSNGDLEKALSCKDRNGANPLHVSCFCGNVEVSKVWVNVIVKTTASQSAAVDLLDRTDGQGRTAYWIACVQGHEDTIGQPLLAATGVRTEEPARMLEEIAQARERRQQRKITKQAIDGNALMGG